MKMSQILFVVLLLLLQQHHHQQQQHQYVSAFFLPNFFGMTSKVPGFRYPILLNSNTNQMLVSKVLENPQFPSEWPYTSQDFTRMDDSIDTVFYTDARLVYHIDDPCRNALTQYYQDEVFTINVTTAAEGKLKKPDVLDICSSWVCHYPKNIQDITQSIVGLGMNEYELQQNPILSSYVVQDLNRNPIMPFANASFDIVTCCVSFDYLIQPLLVMKEIGRILRPNGQCIISISNRCFPTKAIKIWLQTNDLEHVFIIGSFFHYSQCFDPPVAYDKSPNPGRTDPLYIIKARKKSL